VTPGSTIQVHFARDYRLVPYYSKVKIAFVPVGIVTGVHQQPDRTSVIDVKLFSDNRDKLGSEPSAIIRPTTLLGGNYFVDLVPGGAPGRFQGPEIPVQRTQLPVELDQLVQSFQPDALAGAVGFVTRFDATLQGGTNDALHRLFHDAPASLTPTAAVLNALRGTHPETDLTDFTVASEDWTRQATKVPGQLDSTLTNLRKFSTTLGDQTQAFSATLDALPPALASARVGLVRLNTTLDVLEDSADSIRPEARELNEALKHINPVLERARPVIHDLREVVEDAKPLVRKLVPVVRELDRVVQDFHGPVLDRVNGPISKLILNPFKGVGPYASSQTRKPVYQELAYAVADLDRATTMDHNGAGIAFQAFPDPEPDGFVQNDGQPRTETLEHTLVNPNVINPPIQSPGESTDAQRKGSIPFLGGAASAKKEGR
jgi:phospholipid/cholesterol/gamma-HCH transport system substrate-binding protein